GWAERTRPSGAKGGRSHLVHWASAARKLQKVAGQPKGSGERVAGTAGYFATFGRGLDVTLEPFKDLGRRYDLVEIGYSLKAYPCGGRGPTPIAAPPPLGR